MIMLARVVSYGGNSVRYALEKEKAKTVKANNMPDGLDPTAIWYMMKHHCQYHQAERTVGRKLERFMTTFVLSPSKEESVNFTMEDWANLQDEALEVLDSVGLTPNGFSNEIKTNFTNSMNVGGLHSDSKSGTLHLHIDCRRVDMEGNTNDVHDIHLRAMKAAEIINMRHGWEQPQEIRNMRKVELAEDCENTLKEMQQFSIDRYFNLLRMKGYEVKPRYDKQRKLVGYTVGKNASVFKASEIGKGRIYMPSKIEATWARLHGIVKAKPARTETKPTRNTQSIVTRFVQNSLVKVDNEPTPVAMRHFNFSTEEFHHYPVDIPQNALDIIDNHIALDKENVFAKIDDIRKTALLLFANYLDAATTVAAQSGGGGGGQTSGWGRDKDEDELSWAHRCAMMANRLCAPRRKMGRNK